MSDFEKQEWYCALRGVRIGPMSWTMLRERVARGQLGPTDLVWSVSCGNEWRPAALVPGLLPTAPLPGAVPPPPPPSLPAEPVGGERSETDGVVPGSPSIRRAWQRAWYSTRRALLATFDLVRWFKIAICIWLIRLGGINLPPLIDSKELQALIRSGNVSRPHLIKLLQEGLARLVATPFPARELQLELLVWLLYGILFCWLSARGSFMLLHYLERPDTTLRRAWQTAMATSRPLFRWRLLLGVGGWTAVGLVVAGALRSLGLTLIRAGQWDVVAALITQEWLNLWGGMLLFVLVLWLLVASFSFHLMEPLLYVHRDGLGAAWQRVWFLCREHPWAVVRYYLCLGLFLAGAGFLVLGFVLITFGLGALLLMLPVVGGVLLLPLHWFHRAFGVAFLSQIKFE